MIKTFMILSKLTFSLCFLASTALSNATNSDFTTLYDHYFPKHGSSGTSEYRKSFDQRLFGPPPARFSTKRGRQLYYAFRGDMGAFHAFLHNPDRDVNGAQGEEWDYECLLLLLRLGDQRFSELLTREDRSTREGVATALEPLVNWREHGFPRTRALYSFRYIQPSRPEERTVIAIAETGLASGDVTRFEAALKQQPRFSGVQIVGGSKLTDPQVITAPKTMGKRDLVDLQQLVRRELRNNKSLNFEKLTGQ